VKKIKKNTTKISRDISCPRGDLPLVCQTILDGPIGIVWWAGSEKPGVVPKSRKENL